MACCAIETCQNLACAVCTVNVRFRILECALGASGQPCGLVAGHYGDCRPTTGGRKAADKVDTRDGDPKLAAERERRHPMFVKRKREGAFRQQRA